MKTIRKRQEPTRTDDSPLVAALIKQVRAHADELAFRLDAGGASSLHVGAIGSAVGNLLRLPPIERGDQSNPKRTAFKAASSTACTTRWKDRSAAVAR